MYQDLDAEKKLLATLSPGESSGEESIFNEKPRGYAAITMTDATLLLFPKQTYSY